MTRFAACTIALGLAMICSFQASASQSSPDTLTSLVNPCFATSWSSSCGNPPANTPNGWYIVQPTSGAPANWCINYITTGDNCSTGRYSDHRLKLDQLIGSNLNNSFALGKEINWGSYTQATITVKAAGHYWSSGGAGQGKVALGAADGHGTAWSQCGSNVHELTNPSECSWNTLTVVYNKGASSTFTVMLRGIATAGGFNCQFDQLTVTGGGGCTPPATPGAPTVNGATCSTLNVANNAGDSASSYFAIRINGGAYTNQYVQANGSIGASPVWQTKATWGTKTVTGLAASTTYTFALAASASSSGTCPSAYGAGTNGATTALAANPGAPTVSGATPSSLNVAINTGDSSSNYFCIRINGGAYTNQYVQANGTIGSTAVWQTKATWGTKTVTGLAQNTTYTFNVRAATTSGGGCQSASWSPNAQGTTTSGGTGTISGTARNAVMAAVSGVTITTSPATSSTTTNASGAFSLSGVPAGTYSAIYTKSGYQTCTWYNVAVSSGQTTTCPDKLMPRNWSKLGAHVVIGRRDGWGAFLTSTYNCSKPCQMVKCLDDFGAAYDAKYGNPGSGVPANPNVLNVGRRNSTPHYDLQGFDAYADPASPSYTPPATFAQVIFNELHPNWDQNPQIDVWEICNEWSYWWAWQADFYIAMMDIAEANGHRIGLYGCSGGNPPESAWYDVARACARAKAHGGHMLSLHEYCWDGTLQSCYNAAPGVLVGRYRSLYNYLRANNADCPLVLTEVGNNGGGGFIGNQPFVNDMAFYDGLVRQDDYVFGVASWTLGEWSGANWYTALPLMATYICNN